MYNCIYSGGTVLSIPTGPCAPVYGGQELVDAFDQSETVTVYAEEPAVSIATLGAVLLGLVLLGSVFKRR